MRVQYSDVVTDSRGRPRSGIVIAISVHAGSEGSNNLYGEESGNNVVSQVVTNAKGEFSVWLEEGRYDIQAAGGELRTKDIVSEGAAAAAKKIAEEALAVAGAAGTTATGAVGSGIATATANLTNAIRQVGASAGTALTATNPRSLCVSPDSRFVYVANYTSASISVYLKGPLGTLVLIQTISTGTEPSCIAISPDGKWLFAGNRGASTISQYSVNRSTGELTVNATAATAATGAQTTGITIDPNGKYAYSVTEGTHTIYQWEIAATGVLTALGTPTVVPAQTFLQDVIVSPDNLHVYVLSSGNAVSLAYEKEAGGTLKALAVGFTEAVESGPSHFCISSDGLSVYVAAATTEKVTWLKRNAATGTLKKEATYSVTRCNSVAVSTDGRSVCATSETGNTISQFSRETTGATIGALVPVATAPTQTTGTKPRNCAYTPDGMALLVINETSGTIQRHVRYSQLTVLTPYVTNDATILLTAEDENVTGTLRVAAARLPGEAFYIISSNPSDTGNVGWGINETGTTVLTYQRFSATSMPQSAWTPYAPTSVFNKPVPANASELIHGESAAIVKMLLENHSAPQPGNMTIHQSYLTGANTDFDHPLYWAASTDEEWTVKLYGFKIGSALDGSKLKAPSFIKPANGSDAHLVVIQPDGTEWDFWSARLVGKTIEAQAVSKTSLGGTARGSCTAANFALLAGIIRPEEMGGATINHPLFALTPKVTDALTFGNGIIKEGGTGSGCYVWPANHAGGGQTKTEEEAFAAAGQKAPPMGVRLWLQMTVAELEAIANIKPWELTIGKAMIKYGAYVGDRSGGGFGFQFLSDRSYAAAGATDPLYKWAEEQRALANSGMSTVTEEGVNTYVFKPAERIPWATKLRVLVPPATSEPI